MVFKSNHIFYGLEFTVSTDSMVGKCQEKEPKQDHLVVGKKIYQ